MRRHLLYVAAVLMALFISMGQDVTWAQSASPAQPKFEVASVKECKDPDQPPPSTSSPGRLSLGCWPLWRLIADAYDTFATGTVDPSKLLVPLPLDGAPAWVNSARYTIDAKTEGPQSGAMMRGPMMQALLEERFQLKTHRETREIAVDIMTVAKSGPKLHPTEEGSCTHLDPTDLAQSPKPAGGKPWCLIPTTLSRGSITVFDVQGITLDAFAKILHPNRRPVINRTGLTGAFDIHLEWEPDVQESPAPDDGAASLPSPHMSAIAATREQLGLRLDPGKGPREFLIIDHVERPSGN